MESTHAVTGLDCELAYCVSTRHTRLMKIICGNAMQLPMTGSWLIDVTAVKPFTIHGDLYYELQAIRVDVPSAGEMTLRVPQHAARQAPAVGERFTVTFLMGQVTAMAIHA